MSAMGSGGSGLVRRTLRIAGRALIILAVIYIGIVIYAYPHDHERHISNAMVAEIENEKIGPSDVDGSDLPPALNSSGVAVTVAGIDANQNGIRDDAELAIFAEYPTSSPTSTAIRAAELQYAMDWQTLLTKVFDSNTWKAAVVQRERGFGCLYDSTSTGYSKLEDEVDGLVLNTKARVDQYRTIETYAVAYKLDSGPDCDVIR